MAGTTIGRLRVILGADATELDRGLSKTKAQFRAISLAIAGVAAATGTAMLGITRQVVAGANEIQQMARVANAVPEEFQKWAAATSTIGIEQDKLADILKDVNDRVGDFLTTGGGPMADFFDNIAPKVGVTAEQFRRLSGPQALQLYVDSLEKAGVSQGEMTFYLEAMASDLTMMLPLLRDGGAEMSRLGDRAEEFGAVLEGDTLAAMRRAQVAISEVGLVFKGFAYQIATALTPVLEAAATAFTSLASKGQPLNVAFTALVENLGRLATWGATAAAAFGAQYVGALVAARLATVTLSGALAFLRGAIIRTGIGVLIVGAGELVYQFGRLVSGAGGFGEAMSLLGDVAREVWDRIGKGGRGLYNILKGAATGIGAAFARAFAWIGEKWDGLVNGMREPFNKLMGAIGLDASIGASNIEGQLNGIADAWRAEALADIAKGGALIKQAATAPLESLQALRDVLSKTAEDTETAADAADRFNAALAGADGGAGDSGGGGAAGAAKKAKEELTEVEKKAQSTGDAIKQAMTGAFSDVIKGSASFGEALGSVLSKISDMFLNAFGNLAFSGISKALGSVIAGSIPGYANGTPNHPGGLAWVGERGRELVNLPRGAQVIPNFKLGELGNLDRKTQVEIIPSPYFDTRVSEVSRNTTAPMLSGVARAGQRAHGGLSSKMYERGTTL